MWATCANMRGSPWVIGHHPVILAPLSARESAYSGLRIYQTGNTVLVGIGMKKISSKNYEAKIVVL